MILVGVLIKSRRKLSGKYLSVYEHVSTLAHTFIEVCFEASDAHLVPT